PSSATSASYAIGEPVGASNLTDILSAVPDHGIAPAANNMLYTSAVYSDGTRLFVADLSDCRILVWNTIPTVDHQPADFALGQPAGPDNLTTHAQSFGGAVGLRNPYLGIFVQQNSLFVADSSNNRVLVWSPVPTTARPADFALGQPAGANNLD